MRIRLGASGDIEDAALIWERAHLKRLGFVPAATRKEQALTLLIAARASLASTKFLVCEVSSTLVGMLLANQAREADGAGDIIEGLLHVSFVAVHPDYWSCGIASSLLDRVAAEAAAEGYARMQLWVVGDNDRARHVYERSGFRPSGSQKLDGHGETIVHYENNLAKIAHLAKTGPTA